MDSVFSRGPLVDIFSSPSLPSDGLLLHDPKLIHVIHRVPEPFIHRVCPFAFFSIYAIMVTVQHPVDQEYILTEMPAFRCGALNRSQS